LIFKEPLAAFVILSVLLGIGVSGERFFANARPADRFAPVFWLVSGWALVSMLGEAMALLGSALSPVLVTTGVIGGFGLILFGLSDAARRTTIARAALAVALLSPLLWFVAQTPATIFDEFGQWLPNARFLYEHGHFATAADPNSWSAKPGYPPAMPMVIAAGSWLAGQFGETIGKLLVIVLAAGFGMVLADRLSPRFDRLPAFVLGVALATIFNPFFDPRIALTTYADAPTGFVLALTVFAAWNALEHPHAVWILRAATGVILLVLLRETNLVLVGGLCFGLFVLAAAGRSSGAGRIAALIFASAAVPFLVWRVYLHLAEIPPAMVVRAEPSWDWHAPAVVARSLLLGRLFGHPLLGGAAALFLVAATFASWRFARHAGRELATLVAIAVSVSATWVGFLTFAYIAVFAPEEVARAASVWRYIGQLGPTLLLLLATAIGNGPVSIVSARHRRSIAYGGILILVAFQLMTWRHWRIDCRYGDVVSVRQIGRTLLASGEIGDAPLTVINAVEAPAYAVQLDYDMRRPSGRSRGVSALSEATENGFILDLTAVDRAAASGARESAAVPLLRRQGATLVPVTIVPPQPIERSCHLF
jgi:hypothetical protein